MTIGIAFDIFVNESGLLLQNIPVSVALALTTLVCAGWMTVRNGHNFRRAFTLSIATTIGAIGLNVIWYYDAGSAMFIHDSARIGISVMLLMLSLIIAYWLAALLLYLMPNGRKKVLNNIADLTQKITDDIRDSTKDNYEKHMTNPFIHTAKQLRDKSTKNTKMRKKKLANKST